VISSIPALESARSGDVARQRFLVSTRTLTPGRRNRKAGSFGDARSARVFSRFFPNRLQHSAKSCSKFCETLEWQIVWLSVLAASVRRRIHGYTANRNAGAGDAIWALYYRGRREFSAYPHDGVELPLWVRATVIFWPRWLALWTRAPIRLLAALERTRIERPPRSARRPRSAPEGLPSALTT